MLVTRVTRLDVDVLERRREGPGGVRTKTLGTFATLSNCGHVLAPKKINSELIVQNGESRKGLV